jgi:hypothetical protein
MGEHRHRKITDTLRAPRSQYTIIEIPHKAIIEIPCNQPLVSTTNYTDFEDGETAFPLLKGD